jgi:hypothetical protein
MVERKSGKTLQHQIRLDQIIFQMLTWQQQSMTLAGAMVDPLHPSMWEILYLFGFFFSLAPILLSRKRGTVVWIMDTIIRACGGKVLSYFCGGGESAGLV